MSGDKKEGEERGEHREGLHLSLLLVLMMTQVNLTLQAHT